MSFTLNKNETVSQPIFILALLLFFEPLYSQNSVKNDTVVKVPHGSFIQIRDSKSFISSDTIIKIPASLVLVNITRNDKTIAFYDSLKTKASKTILTKSLFDLIIVSPDSVNRKKIMNSIEENFRDYSGKKIRKIQIQRLNVFGVSIDNPGYYQPHGVEKLLNSTHLNTNENVLRKNLLFTEGDTLSPLILSDNERIIRQLPYIDDARIIVIPVSEEEADIIILTKDVYSLGADYTFKGTYKGSFWLFEKNIFGMGHELKLEIPYYLKSPDSPGLGLTYRINNIRKSFVNLDLNYYSGLGKRTYGFSLSRNLVSSTTKYAGGISVRQMFTSEDLDTLPVPEPLKYNYQDYWLLRSFLINKESVTRIIAGARYVHNNIFERPLINPDSYHAFQEYNLYLGSFSLSMQKYYKTNLIYSYGRTEDIPFGGLIRLTAGRELNEFKTRTYIGTDLSYGKSFESLGYLYASAGFGTFFRKGYSEQGLLFLRMKYFSNLVFLGNHMIRNFINIDYTRGFDRYADEYLIIAKENGFTGYANDSIKGNQRVTISIESVIFNPVNIIGFRFAFFSFMDMAFLAGTNEFIANGNIISGMGLGIRIRNDNLVFNTFQIRVGFFPNQPQYSRVNYLVVSGEQLLRPNNFDPGPPDLIPYK